MARVIFLKWKSDHVTPYLKTRLLNCHIYWLNIIHNALFVLMSVGSIMMSLYLVAQHVMFSKCSVCIWEEYVLKLFVTMFILVKLSNHIFQASVSLMAFLIYFFKLLSYIKILVYVSLSISPFSLLTFALHITIWNVPVESTLLSKWKFMLSLSSFNEVYLELLILLVFSALYI